MNGDEHFRRSRSDAVQAAEPRPQPITQLISGNDFSPEVGGPHPVSTGQLRRPLAQSEPGIGRLPAG